MSFSYFDTRSPAAWRAWDAVNAAVTDHGVVVAPGMAPQSLTGVSAAVDIDVDDCGDLHALDAAGTVHRYDPATDSMIALPCLGRDDAGTDPRALCVGPDTLYVADGTDGCVRAYSRELLQLRWASDDRFADPIGLVHDGTAPILVAGGDETGTGQLVRFGPDGDGATLVSDLVTPTAVTVDRAGTLYVLDADATEEASVVRVIPGLERPDGDAAAGSAAVHPLDDTLDGASAIAAIDVDELLVAVDPDPTDVTSMYRLRFERAALELVDRFERGCSALAADPDGNRAGIEALYGLDATTRNGVYRLDSSRTRKRNDRTGRYDAQLITRLDAREPGTRWHRVALELDHADRGSQVRLRYAATDDASLIGNTAALERIDGIGGRYAARLRDAGVADVRQLAAADPEALAATIGVPNTTTTDWARQARELLVDWQPLGEPNPVDALLPAAVGRYLWLELSLIGTEDATPAVSAIRTYLPRRSYLRHLPAVYRDDAASEAFLERFLSLFESLFTGVEDEIDHITQYMDPAGIPSDDLGWLADWLALDIDEAWPDPARRERLARASDLATKRGTGAGLLSILRIYLRHTHPPSAWRDAFEIDATAVIDLVRNRPLTGAEARAALGAHDGLRSLSGDPALLQMLVAWSRVLDQRRALLDALVDATLLSADDREEYEIPAVEIRDSDEGSLRYLFEYATVLDDLTATVESGELSRDDVDDLDDTLVRYQRLIQETASRSGPLLLEGPALDYIDSEAALAPYAALVGQERGFRVLAGPGVEGERMRAVRRIVADEQPAHAAGSAVGLQPWIQLGGHSYLGVNSGLASRDLVLDRATLGTDSVLHSREPFGQWGVKSILGRDSFIT